MSLFLKSSFILDMVNLTTSTPVIATQNQIRKRVPDLDISIEGIKEEVTQQGGSREDQDVSNGQQVASEENQMDKWTTGPEDGNGRASDKVIFEVQQGL